MELEESTFLTSDYTTNLQSSRQYGTSTKKDIRINGKKVEKAQRQTHVSLGTVSLGTLSLTREARIYNGEKTASSMNGVGKS